jgi:hypothetical protein
MHPPMRRLVIVERLGQRPVETRLPSGLAAGLVDREVRQPQQEPQHTGLRWCRGPRQRTRYQIAARQMGTRRKLGNRFQNPPPPRVRVNRLHLMQISKDLLKS